MLNHKTKLHAGESPLQKAPIVTLANGATCTPQHFFAFDHSLDSVETLVGAISFSENYPIFVSAENDGLFLQVGVVGNDNYLRDGSFNPKKIVYGRKWRIERNLPTSEIIQTALLAIKKAREHELRELITLVDETSKKVSTPFNCHHDLPLMAKHSDLFSGVDRSQVFNTNSIEKLLSNIKVGGRTIQLKELNKRPNNYLLDFYLTKAPQESKQGDDFGELDNMAFSIILTHANLNELLYQLMDKLLNISDGFIEEHFLFDGFARFSRRQDIMLLGAFSINTRHLESLEFDESSKEIFREHNHLIDQSRVPVISNEAQKVRLAKLLGHRNCGAVKKLQN